MSHEIASYTWKYFLATLVILELVLVRTIDVLLLPTLLKCRNVGLVFCAKDMTNKPGTRLASLRFE